MKHREKGAGDDYPVTKHSKDKILKTLKEDEREKGDDLQKMVKPDTLG